MSFGFGFGRGQGQVGITVTEVALFSPAEEAGLKVQKEEFLLSCDKTEFHHENSLKLT